jgi:hypothetical protein
MLFDASNPQAHYAAIKAKFNKAPIPLRVVPPLPEPEHIPAPDHILEAEINRLQVLMEGCRIPSRLRLLVLPMVEDCDIPWRDLISSSRKEYLKGPRRKIWAMLQREGLSLPQIGKMFNRDHTTILHGINATR